MKKKKNINFKPFVIIFILIITVIIAAQFFTAVRFETIFAAQGEVIDGFWSDLLIVRDEKVFSTPKSGELKILISEGDRYAFGKKIAQVNSTNQNQNIYNKRAGIVSFAVDGLEAEINFKNLKEINLNNFAKIKGNYRHLISGDKIKEDESLYRIINNFQLHLIAEVPENYSDRFRVNELVFLQEKNQDNLIEARIIDIRNKLDKKFFYIKVEQFIPQWISRRRVNINIIKNIYRGIKIPRQAVFNQLSGQGVLKVSGYNQYEFKEVVILNGNEDYVIVTGLEIGEEIITNPQDLNYGREA